MSTLGFNGEKISKATLIIFYSFWSLVSWLIIIIPFTVLVRHRAYVQIGTVQVNYPFAPTKRIW